jgi:transketolase
MIDIRNVFGEVGPTDWLRERFEMTAKDIALKAKAAIDRKRLPH